MNFRRRNVKSSRLRVHAESMAGYWRWGLVAAAGGLLLFIFFSGPNGTIRLIRLAYETKALKAEITELERDNEKISRDIKRFQTDPSAVEEEARQKLGLVKKGELIYRFPKKGK